MFEMLTDENVMLYAAKAYDRPNCIKSEFKGDFKRFSYLGRLFRRYQKTGELRERLILNHLVKIYNVFGVESSTRLLFYFIRSSEYSVLKPFLILLNVLPKVVQGIRDRDINTAHIPMNEHVISCLRKI